MFGKLSSPKVTPEAVFDEMRRTVVKIVRYIALEFTIRTTQLKVGVQVVFVGLGINDSTIITTIQKIALAGVHVVSAIVSKNFSMGIAA